MFHGPFHGIDFYSDTVTRPTAGMREAIARAEVGDEQKGEDPTTRRLEDRMAEILGHTSTLFFPSATMANEIALMLHCQRGDELIAAANCHLFLAETGGPAVHAGVLAKPIPTATGIFSGEDVMKHFRSETGSHYPRTKCVSVENTTNMGGGIAWPKKELDSVIESSKRLGLKLHLDGSRLFNAAVKEQVDPRELAENFDTVTVCFSKGLGCPTGAVLAFNKKQWEDVRRLKQLMGGSMRQSGLLSAAALYALDHHVARLEEDHIHARRLAEGLSDISGIEVETTDPSTNMVFFHWRGKTSPEAFNEDCVKQGVRFSQVGGTRFRAVTHLDIKASDIDKAVQIVKQLATRY